MRKYRPCVSLATWQRASVSRWHLPGPLAWPPLNEIIINSVLHLPVLVSRAGEKGPIEYISAKLSDSLVWSLLVVSCHFCCLAHSQWHQLPPPPPPALAIARFHSQLPITLYGYSSLTYLTFILSDSTQLLGFGTVSLKGNEFSFKNDFTFLTSKHRPQTNHATPWLSSQNDFRPNDDSVWQEKGWLLSPHPLGHSRFGDKRF